MNPKHVCQWKPEHIKMNTIAMLFPGSVKKEVDWQLAPIFFYQMLSLI